MALARAAINNASPTTVYTSSGASVTSVIYVCNTGTAQTFDLHLVTSGGTADATNLIYSAVPLTAADTYVLDKEKIVLANGDFIAAKAGSFASTIIVTVSYMGA
jgi:hypothetical protein